MDQCQVDVVIKKICHYPISAMFNKRTYKCYYSLAIKLPSHVTAVVHTLNFFDHEIVSV